LAADKLEAVLVFSVIDVGGLAGLEPARNGPASKEALARAAAELQQKARDALESGSTISRPRPPKRAADLMRTATPPFTLVSPQGHSQTSRSGRSGWRCCLQGIASFFHSRILMAMSWLSGCSAPSPIRRPFNAARRR